MLVGITGGTGFIGKALVLRHIVAGDTVRLLSRCSENKTMLPKSVELFHGDLTGQVAQLVRFVDKVDILYHCAAETKDQNKMHSVNVEGTRNLCIAASQRIGHWVQLSSVGTYGSQYRGIITEETPLLRMGSIYEKTKTESDQLVIDFSRRSAFTYSILRPCKILGLRMTDKSVFQMITFISKGIFFFIGKSGASANYVHVDNVVEGLVLCGKMSAAKGRIYNLSDHRTIEDFVGIIANELRKPLPKLRLPEIPVRWIARLCEGLPHFPLTAARVKGLTSRAVYSIERIQHELGYVHQVSIEDGLRQMVNAWKQATLKTHHP